MVMVYLPVGLASCAGASTDFFWQHGLPADALPQELIEAVAVVPSAFTEALASPSFLQQALAPPLEAQASDLCSASFLSFFSAKVAPAIIKANESMRIFFIALIFSTNKDNQFPITILPNSR